ncbi:hypothetical protein KR215_005890 [Drosophila sulfurigaster]|nr:hypothetical protein KR215_005890 [Drosophila sulfurigaster]
MIGSLFSSRYNSKMEIIYAQNEETRSRFPILPFYVRPKEPFRIKHPKQIRKAKKYRPADYDYDEIAGNFVPIVVRRGVELWSCRQLMELAPIQGIDVCSWRSWPREDDGAAKEKAKEALRRRSMRLTDKPNLKLKDIGNSRAAIKWQQRLPTLETGTKRGSTAASVQEMTFIDGCVLQCNMCGSNFGMSSDLQLHSLDECRRHLLATLSP